MYANPCDNSQLKLYSQNRKEILCCFWIKERQYALRSYTNGINQVFVWKYFFYIVRKGINLPYLHAGENVSQKKNKWINGVIWPVAAAICIYICSINFKKKRYIKVLHKTNKQINKRSYIHITNFILHLKKKSELS